MSQESNLQRFVRKGLESGRSKAELAAKLHEAGWPEDDVRSAVGAWADVDSPLPVPRPAPYLPAREAFLYLVLFLGLYLAAYNVGSLLFAFIERAFPDPAAPYLRFGHLEAVRFSTAAVAVTLPVFVFLHRFLERSLQRAPRQRESRVRKWLTYLTLFVAAGFVVGDLIAVLTSLLSGELTVRFVLKATVVLVIAGAAFGYYLSTLRREDAAAEGRTALSESFRKPARVLAFEWAAVALMVAVGVAGAWVAGSPATARTRRLDEQRLGNLVRLSNAIEAWYEEKKALPESLEAMVTSSMQRPDITDPETDERYEYRILAERRYELCAVFRLPTPEERPDAWQLEEHDFWRHGAGRTCFEPKIPEPQQDPFRDLRGPRQPASAAPPITP